MVKISVFFINFMGIVVREWSMWICFFVIVMGNIFIINIVEKVFLLIWIGCINRFKFKLLVLIKLMCFIKLEKLIIVYILFIMNKKKE